jgi:hypothetical protein
MAEMKADAAKDIATLKAKLTEMEARALQRAPSSLRNVLKISA